MAWHGKLWHGPILLLLPLVVVVSEATAKTIEYRYETAYACEGKTLKIECKDGELIKLIRANYGRFSITICNDHGNTDWSVNCMSPKSLRVLHSRCTQYQNCSIPASTSMFGDPCPGTHKYLEAHYQCLPATASPTTSRPTPPWLITSQPPMWSTIKPPSTRAPQKSAVTSPSQHPGNVPSSSSVSPTASGGKKDQSSFESPIEKGKTDDEFLPPNVHDTSFTDNKHHQEFPEPPDEITTLPFTTVTPGVNKKITTSDATASYTPYMPSVPSMLPSWAKDSDQVPYHCSPTTVRSIYWNWTRVNTTSIQPCPGGTTGFAKWHCAEVPDSQMPRWYPENPDLSECRSVWLTSLDQRIPAGRDQLVSITSDLAQVTSSKTLYGGDMAITTKIIRQITEKMSQDIQTFPDTRQREAIATEMLMDVAKTSSNLLDSSQHASWKDLSYKEQMSVATSLLIGLEENAFLLADTVMSQKTVNKEFKNILLSVRVLDTKFLENEVFPSEGTQNEWRVSNDSIELPKGPLLKNSDGNLVRLVFVAFDRLEEILQWQPDASDVSHNISKVLNSKVISASLGKGRHIQLKEPVKLTLKHLKTENVSNPTCVFWDYTTSSWSEEGCHVDTTQSNYSHTVCYCDHLTNFAILMDVHAIYLPIPHEIALQVITYVGCIISIICLILAIVTFQLFRGLKSDRTTIHCNLCVCLVIAEFLFVIGISQTENRIFCGIVAGSLQYFFLCAFVWMFFEGFQIYVMVIEVFEVEKSRVRWYYFFAYGLPFLIVFISATIYPQGYGTQRHCWLQTDNYFIYSFVGPVIIVMMLNVIFLTMAIVMMCRHASASVSMKNKEHSRLASTRTWLKGAFALVFLLGLTWTFGLLYINQESVPMAYLFSVMNSLQGFFIFLFHCVQNEKVRKEYRKVVRRHSWLPRCLRCSKSASGAPGSSGSGSGSGGTSGTTKERRTSIYAGSNGNPSGGTISHSTDNSVLTPHGTSLQRGWNSQSLTNVNRACRTPVPTSTSANTAATLSRPIRHCTTTPPDVETNNTSTLPYVRNFYKNTTLNPNIPKSISTWGPLHKPLHWKNISFKSYSRDSGHGGSEQEDSPRSHMVIADAHRMPHVKDVQRQPQYSDYGMRQILQHSSTTGRKKNGSLKPLHWGHHTYTEIYDGQNQREKVLQKPIQYEDDPVYEEIDRNEIQVSDMSDEDGKRQSDMSRQSSRSYGDHRPLIPYSPGGERSFLDTIDMDGPYRMRCNNIGLPMYRGGENTATARSLAAVLDGETVVCHLEPPEMYPGQHLEVNYVSRTNLPPYSES